LDAGQLDDGRPWLVAEYVEGTPVDRYCAERGLSRAARIELIERIGEALAHAHTRLVLHLDIKPDNILIADDGTPRLLDFGVARLVGDADTGHDAFTANYASPEQLRGETPTVASDVFALGVLAYQLFTGSLPFEAARFLPRETQLDDRAGLVERVRREAGANGLDTDLTAVLAKAMAADPQQRYGSLEPFLRDLYNYRKRRPVSARPRTFGYRLQRYVQRNAVAVAAVLGVITLLGLFGLRESSLRQQAQQARALAEEEAETSRRVSDFLVTLFKVSDPSEARGNSVTARELLDSGAERIREDLDGQPRIASRLMAVMGDVYTSLGLYEDSAVLFEDAMAQLREIEEGDSERAARALTALGDAYRRQARFDEAEAPLTQALAIREATLAPDDVRTAYTLRILGDLYMRRGEFDDALRTHERGLGIWRASGQTDEPDYAKHLLSTAMVLADQGRGDEAEAMYLKGIDIVERAMGEDHPDLGNFVESLGNLYNALERFDDAERYLKRGLAIRTQVLADDHPLLSYSFMNLGALYGNRHELEKSSQMFGRAMEIQQKAFGDDDYRLGITRFNLADTYRQMDRMEEALELALLADAALAKQLQPDHPYMGYLSRLLGRVYAALGDPAAAEQQFRRSIDIFASRPDDDPVKLTSLEAYAFFLRAQGREDEADALRQR
ncbi:MAG: serine/threonine-protein kinase, partial [Pseudomonadota bacterium]